MKLPKIQWGVYGGLSECPYFRKWVVDFGPFSLRLHRWYADDDHRAPHDHPYWFYTFILRGGYRDVRTEVLDAATKKLRTSSEILTAGCLRFRPAEHLHSVQDVLPNTWTVLITGRPIRKWGFLFNGKLIKRDKWFAEHGHHPCDGAEPVRMKPDGSRING